MEIARTFDALLASARAGHAFATWWCLADPTDQEVARAYFRAYLPFYRGNTEGEYSDTSSRLLHAPRPNSPKATEVSCNAIGKALLDHLGLGWTAQRTGWSGTEETGGRDHADNIYLSESARTPSGAALSMPTGTHCLIGRDSSPSRMTKLYGHGATII